MCGNRTLYKVDAPAILGVPHAVLVTYACPGIAHMHADNIFACYYPIKSPRPTEPQQYIVKQNAMLREIQPSL